MTQTYNMTLQYVIFKNPRISSNRQENKYYYAKSLKEESAERASEQLKALIESANENEDTEWIFKSYKQLAKISFQHQNYAEVLDCIGRLVLLLPKINGNYAEESINKLLIRYSASSDQTFVSRMYEVIISQLQDSWVSGVSGRRLWLKININRLNNLLENGSMDECPALISAINSKLETVSELTQNSYVLDVVAAEIEYISKTHMDLSKLSVLYQKSTEVTSAITHPRVMGIIRECGATLHFYRKNYEKARVEFYECFKHYDEAGSLSKKKILKYLSLCSLLTESEVNPFESQETQTYSQLAEYENLISLVESYENQDLDAFLSVIDTMQRNKDVLVEDDIFVQASKQILHNLKVKLLLNLLKAYRTIRFDFVIKKLRLADDDELEQLTLRMANAGTGADIRVDFCDRYIELVSQEQSLFPVSLDTRTIFNNFCALHSVGFTGPWQDEASEVDLTAMDVDEAPQVESLFKFSDETVEVPQSGSRDTVFDKLLMLRPPRQDEKALFLALEEWFEYLRSAVPAKAHNLLSQKDQIYSEQQEDNATDQKTEKTENQSAEANTNAGILGSSINYAHTHDEKEEEEVPQNKLDVLHKWVKELGNKYREMFENRSLG